MPRNMSEIRQHKNVKFYESRCEKYPHELWVNWKRGTMRDMQPDYLDRLRQAGAFKDHFIRIPFPRTPEIVYMFTNAEDLAYFTTLVENKHTP